MIHFVTIKIVLIFLLINLSSQLFGQTNEFGIIKGKILDEKTGDGIPYANIYTKPNLENIIDAQSDINGVFELEMPTGKHIFYVSYVGHEDYAKEITVEPNDTLVYEILLIQRDVEEIILLPDRPNELYTNFSLELFGTWEPVKGKLKCKKVKRFTNETEVIFDWRNDIVPKKVGSIHYKDGESCNSNNTNLTYRYTDIDFISFHYYSSSQEDLMCDKNKFWIGAFFKALSKNGCNLQFNEAKDVVTLQYEKNFLVLKRKE